MKYKGLILMTILLSQTAQANFVKHFPTTYEDSRARFLKYTDQIKNNYSNVESGRYFVASKIDKDLTTDWFYIPATEKQEKLLVLTSGTHGVEAFAGSAVQQLFISEILPGLKREKLGILLVHSMNPFGFKYHRRVTENNVDLNRSYVDRTNGFSDPNDKYHLFDKFLNPDDKVDLGFMPKTMFLFKSVLKLIKHSKKALRQAILQGQYSFPKGIYFGGNASEPQQEEIRILLTRVAEPYKDIFFIDLHTGYGKRGTLHFFGSDGNNQSATEAIKKVFSGYQIDEGSDDDFYETTGDFVGYIPQILKDKLVLPMTFEYGTLDSQKISGSIESLRRSIIENQGFHWGYENEQVKKETQELYMNMFNPPEEEWRVKILSYTKEHFPILIDRFLNL